MKHTLDSLAVVLAIGCLLDPNGWAYDLPIHEKMSGAAFDLVYPDPQLLLQPLGIRPGQRFSGKDPRQWITEGSKSEDNFPRTRNHFFDPISGRGLNGTTPLGTSYEFRPAPDWALNVNVNNENPLYSVPGARESFFLALTTNDHFVRERHWASTFEAVGRIVHLIQDMAQPQHVRNDIHLSPGEGPIADSFFPDFSRYERYTDAQERRDALTYTGYTLVKLPAFRKYWIDGSRKGLAEFSNRYFVSQSTNFDKIPGQQGYYALPSLSETSSVEVTVAQPTDYRNNPILDPDGVPYTNIKVRYLSINYTDTYDGTFSGTNPRLATYSMFDFVSATNKGKNVYSLDNAVYDSTAQILIPRAVGYSAGLINYFFRGKLEITPPAEGVYALVDHSQPDANTKDTGGFTKIKVKVKNVTPGPLDQNGQPTVEPIQGSGTLRAVVKFRRNDCYEPQKLLGQPGAPGYGAGCKTAVEELAVSEPKSPADFDQINSANGQDITFSFLGQNVIPINATDVYLQVVYRGQLGEETDAVVVATKDISEPSFYNFDNYSDCQINADGTYSTVPGVPLTANMSFNGGATYNANVANLAPGTYARFALFAENYFLPVFVQNWGAGYPFGTVVNQNEGVAGGVANPTPILKARPTTVPPGGDSDYVYGYDGFGYYPYLNGSGYLGAQGCPTPVAATPNALTIVFE